MSTFDIETPEEVWPVGTKKTIITVKKYLLQEKKQSLEETTRLNLPLNRLMLWTETSILSAPSIQFLERTFDAQFNNTARKRKKTGGVDSKDSKDSKRCMQLESLLSRLLCVILKDTIKLEQQHQLDGMHRDLVRLFDNLIETQSEDSTSVEYSPRLESVVCRIAISGLVKIDSSNSTVEFEL